MESFLSNCSYEDITIKKEKGGPKGVSKTTLEKEKE